MIKLDIQIKSLIFSFLFGCIFYLMLELFNRIPFKNKICLKIIFSFIFVLIMSLLYFLILLYINNGYLHIYFIILIMVGYLFIYLIHFYLFTHCKRK